MSGVTINSFKGSVPRVASHLMPPGSAHKALDCNLHSGELSSWREPKLVIPTMSGAQDSVVLTGCCYLPLAGCVDVAEGFVNCPSRFMTGHPDYSFPIQFMHEPNAGSSGFSHCALSKVVRLGFPCTLKAPTLSKTQVLPHHDKDFETVFYAYQLVDSYGHRSQLSLAASTTRYAHDRISIYGWDILSAPYGITEVRIFRSVSGDTSGKESTRGTDTAWMLVGVSPVGASYFDDTSSNDELFEALIEDVVVPPPDTLKGITNVAGLNVLVGYSGKSVFFSEHNNPASWPHQIDLEDNVMALVESNGIVYVATDGHPYTIEASVDPLQADQRSVVRLPYPMPMIAAGSRHMAATSMGAVYPSHKGLVALHGANEPVYATWGFYSPEDWQRMQPWTAKPVQFDGKLYCFMANGAFCMAMPQGPEAGWGADGHTELSDRDVVEAFVTRDGRFFLFNGTQVHEWNRGAALRPHLWESHEHVTPTPVAYGAGHLAFRNGPEHVKVEVDGKVVVDRAVASSRVFRLPMWANGTRWKITLSGTGDVSLASLSPTMQEFRP